MTVEEVTVKLKKMPQSARILMEYSKGYNDIESIFIDTDGIVVLSEFDE